MNLSDMQTMWDTWYNSPLIHNPTIDYLAVSILRILVAWAMWHMLKALWQYANAALPPPHTLDNLNYWMRWWLWLRLRERPLLKVSAVVVALAALLQIFGGVAGLLNDCSPYFLLMCGALISLGIALAREFHALTAAIKNPTE